MEKRRYAAVIFLVFTALLVVSTLLVAVSSSSSVPSPVGAGLYYTGLIAQINMTNVQRHVEYFSSLGTRYTGYPGNEEAARYVYDYFRNLSLSGMIENVSLHDFPIVTCRDYGANVTVLTGQMAGNRSNLYPLLPNLVCPSTTPPEGLVGPLIYARGGHFKDFEGLEVNGSIVLLDWDSRDRWLNAAKYGAKAVIFIPPPIDSPSLAFTRDFPRDPKYLPTVPFNFPRFYLEKDGLSLLKAVNETVRVVSTQRWEEISAHNVLAFVRGKQRPNPLVAVTAYFDSGSIVPSLAPGAQESCGIACLLEVARLLNKPENQPQNSIIFIALNAHHQYSLGAQSFIRDYLLESWGRPETLDLGLWEYASNWRKRIKFDLNLDLSTGSNSTFWLSLPSSKNAYVLDVVGDQGGAARGYPTWDSRDTGPWNGFLRNITTRVEEEKPAGKTYHVYSEDTLTDIEPGVYPNPFLSVKSFYYDSEMFMFALEPSITFTTAYDNRPFFFSPFDTVEKLNFENLQPQLEFFYIALNEFANVGGATPTIGDLTKFISKNNDFFKNTFVDKTIYRKVVGQVAEYNPETDFYDPVGNAIVFLVRTKKPTHVQVALADENGTFEFCPGRTRIGTTYYAFVINETTGNVIYATDQGRHRWRWIPPSVFEHRVEDMGLLTVFKASMMVFFDTGLNARALDHDLKVNPDSYGVFRELSGTTERTGAEAEGWAKRIVTLAAPPGIPLDFIFRGTLLLNSNPNNPQGEGYTLEAGEQYLMCHSDLESAKAYQWINSERLKVLLNLEPSLTSTETYRRHVLSAELLEKADQALELHKYSEAELYSSEALASAREANNGLKTRVEDAASVVPILAFFLVPFSFLAEKLIFGWRGSRRILSFLGTFGALMSALYFLHPGFTFCTSPLMIIIGWTGIIAVAPILFVSFQVVRDWIREAGVKLLGPHEVDVSRFGDLGTAFIIGVEHMKRHKLRTSLTLATVILMVSSLVSLTSATLVTRTMSIPVPTPFTPLYEGVYVHGTQWTGDMAQILPILQAKYENVASVVPRAWQYIFYYQEYNYFFYWEEEYAELAAGFRIEREGKTSIVPTLWGLTPEDKELENFFMLPGFGRWFEPSDRRAMILPRSKAAELGINRTDIPANVTLEGVPYKVIGVVEDDIARLRDLDAEEITPLKYDYEPGEEEITYEEHVPAEYVAILPFNEVVDIFGGRVASISLKFKDKSLIRQAPDEISDILPRVPIWSYVKEQCLFHSRTLGIQVGGLGTQMAPMAIMILAVLNTTLGSVYERRKTIATYSMVGLSPLHTAFMFLAENVVYAVLGGIGGYILAMLLGRLALLFLPFLRLNYSSRWVFIALGASMCATIAASLYPALLASKLVTPSFKRRWTLGVMPTEDTWEIPLPFQASDHAEAGGIVAYINEYVKAHGTHDAPIYQASNVRVEEGKKELKTYKELLADVRLSPYDLGVTQSLAFRVLQVDPQQDRWVCHLVIERTGGDRNQWTKLNRNFIDTFRKQLLLWRGLKPKEREHYISALKR